MREWLIALRKAKKLTQTQLAEEVGISQSYVTSIENGKRRVPVWTAKKIAAALGFEWQKFYEDDKSDAR